ncbi:NFX1-type zinc finger-containing protein 1-like [Watersipora subatra]|uniref:NFX1-type zinc finger-containing protein 1-like n=1 Tax=Watersipora subatra TaxID=2589382 RepID=UPI00355B7EA5
MTDDKVEELRALISKGKLDITSDLSEDDRWCLYRYLVRNHQSYINPAMKTHQENYRKLLDIGDDLKMQQEIEALKTAKVIGMTTTGAARLQKVLQAVGPEIVIVEEAAEVLEAHIVTALSKKCQHLILIGDHKQLKPSPTVYDLAVKYHLDLSLFERMVNNGLPISTLNIQHRMRPEISKYIRGHIYDRLDDHQSVLDRDPVEGMKNSVFFFNHNNPEVSDEGTMSKSNKFEAQMIAELTRYLLLQESYKPDDITIITMYTGQLLLLQQYMPRSQFEGVKITSVDNFQGEENKIVIISLVRSNPEGNLGFVKIENRVCVAMSRAQYGMYVFGNFDMLSRGSALWRKIVEKATSVEELDTSLILRCQIHKNPAFIKKPGDFRQQAPTGGCELECMTVLKCGHICKMKCHSKDWKHERYQCTEPCPRSLPHCEHSCTAMCHQECPPCPKKLKTTLPCGHNREEQCHKLTQEDYIVPCVVPCSEVLPCDHSCLNRCSEKCTEICKALVEKMCSKCDEIKLMKCHEATEIMSCLSNLTMKYSYRCDTPCNFMLTCGHKCPGACYECGDQHQSCPEICGKRLKCGHICDKPCQDCTDNGECRSCNQSCLIRCSHGVWCSKDCSSTCEFIITTEDTNCQFGCKHTKLCERDCGDACSIVPCDKSCDKMIVCKFCHGAYHCNGFCGEPCPLMCPNCDQPQLIEVLSNQLPVVIPEITSATRWVVLEDCQHFVPAEYMHNLVFGADPETLIFCPFLSCGMPLLNTHRYMSRIRPVTPGSHTVQLDDKIELETENEATNNKPSDQKRSAKTELENSLAAKLFVYPSHDTQSQQSDSGVGGRQRHNDQTSKFSDQTNRQSLSRSTASSKQVKPKKLTAKDQLLRNPPTPPKRPPWMTVHQRKEEFKETLRGMTEQLNQIRLGENVPARKKPAPNGSRSNRRKIPHNARARKAEFEEPDYSADTDDEPDWFHVYSD